MWIVRWDPFLMKKLLKSEIRGSVNSAQCELIVWKLFDKSNFVATVYAQCMNNSRNSKICPKIREKKEQNRKNANIDANAGPKHTLNDLLRKISHMVPHSGLYGSVWYMYLKTENCYLKTFVKIRVSEKMCRNTCNVV